MTTTTDSDALLFVKLLVLRLDPVLRLLLASIARYKDLCAGERAVSNDHEARPRRQEEKESSLLSLLQAQSHLLKQMESLLPQETRQDQTEALAMMNESFLLPLVSILSCYPRRLEKVTMVHQSALRKVIGGAANTLSLYASKVAMTVQQERKCWAACLVALPTEQCVSDDTLDKGEASTTAVLTCLQTVCSRGSKEHNGDMLVQTIMKLTAILSNQPFLVLDTLDVVHTLLKTYESLVKAWRSLLPVFAPLFGLVLGHMRGKHKATVAEKSLACIASLLHATCHTIRSKAAEASSVELIARIQRSQQSQNDTDAATARKPPEDEQVFVSEVNERLAAPLTVLLNILPTSSSRKVHKSLGHLCQTIIKDMGGVWDSKSSSLMNTAALECCLVLGVQVQLPQTNEPAGVYSERVTSLLEELPTLCQSQREVELRAKLKLLRGYSELGGINLSYSTESFCCACTYLFDIDFEAIEYAPVVLAASDTSFHRRKQRLRLRYLSEETANLAYEFVSCYAVAVGTKSCLSLVDNWVADMFESFTSNLDHGMPLTGAGHLAWLHEWIAAIVVGDLLLSTIPSPSIADGKGKARRHRKRTKAFAEAMLSLITTSQLWNLPSKFEDQIWRLSRPTAPVHLRLRASTERVDAVASSTLKGNAAAICILVQFVRTALDLLGHETKGQLPTVLFPLVEKAAKFNLTRTQQAANDALSELAIHCGYSSIDSLLRSNFDYVFGTINSRLRLARQDFPRNLLGVASFVLEKGAVATETTDTAIGPTERSLSSKTNMSFVLETLNRFTAVFDRWMQGLNSDDKDLVAVTTELCDLYRHSLSFILSSFGFDPHVPLKPEPSKVVNFLDLLDEFKSQASNFVDARDAEQIEVPPKVQMDITDNEIDFVSLTCARCCYALSIGEIKVQVAGVRALTMAFNVLGHASFHFIKEDPEAINTHETAILRQINTSWPPIISKIRMHTRSFAGVETNQLSTMLSISGKSTQRPKTTAASCPFLQRLLELVATMVESSGDFAVPRIRQELWPQLVKILEVFLRRKEVKEKNRSRNANTSAAMIVKQTRIASEEEKLLVVCLDFVKRIFSCREAGIQLSNMIPPTGTLILPLLDDLSVWVRDSAMSAFKAMLEVNNDALMRPLFSVSCHQLPGFPLWPEAGDDAEKVESSKSLSARVVPSLLQSQATELLFFANSLAEQSLD